MGKSYLVVGILVAFHPTLFQGEVIGEEEYKKVPQNACIEQHLLQFGIHCEVLCTFHYFAA